MLHSTASPSPSSTTSPSTTLAATGLNPEQAPGGVALRPPEAPAAAKEGAELPSPLLEPSGAPGARPELLLPKSPPKLPTPFISPKLPLPPAPPPPPIPPPVQPIPPIPPIPPPIPPTPPPLVPRPCCVSPAAAEERAAPQAAAAALTVGPAGSTTAWKRNGTPTAAAACARSRPEKEAEDLESATSLARLTSTPVTRREGGPPGREARA